jgi:hypothetical protein
LRAGGQAFHTAGTYAFDFTGASSRRRRGFEFKRRVTGQHSVALDGTEHLGFTSHAARLPNCAAAAQFATLFPMTAPNILINRAPVLTLWATTVAERLGFDRDEALSLGKAVAGLTAQSKGRRLGIYKPAPQEIKKARARKRGEEFFVEIAGRQVPAVNTEAGVRAVIKDKPIAAQGVERYLESKFGESLGPVREAMRQLAKAFRPEELSQNAFHLYEKFRPAIPEDVTGWGAKGRLDIDRIRSLASEK